MKNFNIKKEAIFYPIIILSAMWGNFLLQRLEVFQQCFGAIIPLHPSGLKGVFMSPFFHASLEHIISNSLPMAVLLFLLFQFYHSIAKKILFISWVATGFLVWSLPPIDIHTGDFYYSCIIGASGIVYVLAFFLFFSGIFRWNPRLIAITLIVGLYYGGLIWGIFPEELFYQLDEPSRVSWQSHLSGAAVGTAMAFLFRKIGEKNRKFIWQFPNYYNEKDDLLWQEYIKKHPEDFQELPKKKKESIWEHLEKIRNEEQ